MVAFNRVAVFSATKAMDRQTLGQRVTSWLQNYEGDVVDQAVRQSSDSEFHCLSIILFCRDNQNGGAPQRRRARTR